MKEKRYKLVESPDGKTLNEMVEIGHSNIGFLYNQHIDAKAVSERVVKALLGGGAK